MASDMILNTPPSTHQVEKWFLETLNCKFGLKSIISCIFSCCVEGNFSFSRFTRKWMGLELRVVISANINSTIAVLLKKKIRSLRPSEAKIRCRDIRENRANLKRDFRDKCCAYKLNQWVSRIQRTQNRSEPSRKLGDLEMHTGLSGPLYY